MKAGKLRHKITIQDSVVVENEIGNSINTWKDFIKPWSAAKPVNGKESFIADRLQSEITMRFEIRYAPGIKSSMRVKFKDRLFKIEYILNIDEKDVELHLMCSEVDA